MTASKLKVVLTFDDGTEDHYSSAFKIMKKYNVTGSFYIITDKVDTPGRLSSAQIEEMSRYGNEIASHSASHPIFTVLNEDSINEELNKSYDYLEGMGYYKGGFAYPGHRRNDYTDSLVLKHFPYIRPNVHQGTEILRDDVSDMLEYIETRIASGVYEPGVFVNIHLVKPEDYPSSPYVVHESNFELFLSELKIMDVEIVTAHECFYASL